MATLTGSTTIDWSTVSLGQVDVAAHFTTFLNRVDQILTAIQNPANYSIVSASRAVVVLDLVSGGRLRLGISRSTPPLTTSFSFSNTATGEVLQYSSRVLANGIEFVTSATIGSTGFSETITGNILIPEEFPPNGQVSGLVTSVVVKVGSATLTFSGMLNMTGDLTSSNLTGTVTGVAAVSGANSIKMTGLSVDIDVIEAAFAADTLSTVNDLFSVIGSQMNDNDVITYTNNSGTGMSFLGGAGNDTITISGPRGDTLNGGAGNDTLNGGPGQDTVSGGVGNDQITMLVTAGNEDTIDAGSGTDTLVLSGVVGGNGLVVVDLSAADQVVSIAGDPNRDNQVQTGFEGVNGALLGSAMTVTGSDGDNLIIGSNGNDSIDGGDGNDTLIGGRGNDTLIGGLGDDVLNGGTGNDIMTGGAGNDTYVIDSLLDVFTEAANEGTDTVQINRSVDLNVALFAEIENVVLTGTRAINATGDAGNNQLTGNNSANMLTGGDGNDTLIGNAGNDKLDGGTGDDEMDGGAGNDTLNGGAGQDSARYGGLLSEYVLGTVGGMLTVTDRNRLNGNEGTDLVTGIEQLHFADATLTVARGKVQVNTWTTGAQSDGAVAGLANGGYVVTWTSADALFSSGIYAQRYTAQGLRVGGETRVNTTTTGSQSDSAVTGLANGGYVVTWTSADALFSSGIYVQRYTAQGLREGGETRVNTTTTGSQSDSAVTGLANGGYVVTWRSVDASFSDGIYAQRYSAQGVPVDGETLVNTTTAGSQSDGAVAGLADGGYVVTWRSVDAVFSTSIYAQRYDAQGAPVGGETLVNTTPANAGSETAVAGLADGGYIVTWRYENPSFSYSMYAQRYDAQGVPMGGEILVDTTTAGSQSGGAVAGLANGGYVVTWRTANASFSGLYSQPFDAQGEALGGYIVTGTAGADQLTVGTHSLLTVDGTGGNDVLTGGASSDRLLGGDGNDILIGGAGADFLQGGAGDDMFLLGSVADFAAGELLEGGAGNFDLLRYTGTVGTLILTDLVQGIEYVETTSATGSALGTGAVNINAMNVSEPIGLIGNNGANVLTGTVFDDTLYGNGGNDTLKGGSGSDTYEIRSGSGQDRIVEQDDTPGNSDSLDYGSAIDPGDLVLSRQVNDLRIAVQGTTDRVTIVGWYADPDAAQVETIQAGNGQTLLSTQVDQLIQAMAAFTQQNGISWDAAAGGAGDPTQQAQFQGIIAANWQS
jgi:Ca2+-binding RTX toxin-like protein